MAGNDGVFTLIETICREATRCRACFDSNLVRPAFIDIAQPRYIGPGYWTAKCRVAVVMLNPGQGRANAADQEARRLMYAFRDGAPLAPVLDQQRAAMPNWGRGKYAPFIADLGLNLDSIATANIAMCATSDNQYPDKVLNSCWLRHTAPLLSTLLPHVVVLCGAKAHSFASRIGTKTVCAPHYATRVGSEARDKAMAAARRAIEAAARNQPNLVLRTSRSRGRPPKQKPVDMEITNVEQFQKLRASVSDVIETFLSGKSTLDAATLEKLSDSITHELGHFKAAQDRRGRVKLPKPGQKRDFPAQAFLNRLEHHFLVAGIRLVDWQWDDKSRMDALPLAEKLLECIGVAALSFRQWRQRHFFR